MIARRPGSTGRANVINFTCSRLRTAWGLDTTGKELHSFTVNLGTRLFGGRLHMLPNGRVLVPHNAENKVVEYDINGKAVWQVEIEQPVAATRLPNGNTLVTTMTQNRAVEFDRSGREVWEYKTDTRVTRALRR